MTRRKTTAGALLFAFFLLIQCQSPGDSDSFATEPEVEIDLEAIQQRGYLVALIDNTSVSYFIYKGRPMGFEYELARRFADYLKVSLKIKLVTGIEQAIDMLNKGEGDVLALPLTITEERKQFFSFTNPQFKTTQVLVQKKPANWRMQPPQLVEKKLVRDTVQLVGKEIHVMRVSSFKERLTQLNERLGGGIQIIEDVDTAATESLIRKVATGEIKYTVTDQVIATVNSLYYSNIDINTVLSEPQEIAWGVRNNSPELLHAINTWQKSIKKNGIFQITYNKYFKNLRSLHARITSDYSSLRGGKLSPYDEYLKKGAEELGWDWRLLAAIVYQESNFNPQVESWAGAIGLMQIMPETGAFFGVDDLWDPLKNIRVGIKFLKFLDKQWAKTVPLAEERLKFVLASYNVGLSHVIDAQKLARKYEADPTKWEGNVEYYLSQKSNPKYYRDPVVVVGYCRCDGPINYVREVLQRYEEYKLHIDV